MRRVGQFLLGLVSVTLLSLGGCTVSDDLLEDKLCDRTAPINQQCIKGYTPTVRDGKCICVPVLSPTPSPDA
ncbi:MAG: hypothetical protein JRH20_24945 [Deltaproteobacteria bacterium]|nr:hypothetical protein [Deltaproteobacteria bacterium]